MMMHKMSSEAIKLGILLIALAYGYIVCYLADREEKDLRKIGYIIGIFIIAVSFFMIVYLIIAHLKLLTSGFCPLSYSR